MKTEVFKTVIVPKAEAAVDVPTGVQDRAEKERLIGTSLQEWSKIIKVQRVIVANLRIDKDEKYGQLLKYYRFDDSICWNDSQIKSQILSNPDYVKICRDLAEQEAYLDYCVETLDNIKTVHYIIKEYNAMKQQAEGSL